MAIKNVAVVGASGNVGAPTVTALLAAGFHVTAITRPSSTATFPAGVSRRDADLTSVESLTAALQGQDAVVAAFPPHSAPQIPLIDAAVAAGVQRFIPSEFGTNSQRFPENVTDDVFKGLFQNKIEVIDYLRKKSAEKEGFTWTGVATSLFFHWGLDVGTFGISLKNKTASIFDSGNTVVSTSNLDFIGRVVASILAADHLAATANQYIDVWQFTTTQNELLALLEAETGSKFAVTRVATADLEKAGKEKLAGGDHMTGFINLLLANGYRDGATVAAPKENAAWTILGLGKEDLKESVGEYVKSRSA